MKLLIDAGNTRIKLAGCRHAEPSAADVLSLAHAELADALPGWLAAQGTPFRQAYGVNVAGAALGAQLQTLLATAGCALTWLQPSAEALGLRNGYDRPAQLGADRWAALLGLWRRYQHSGQPLLLCTFGTATTVDAISSDGEFLGGLILPGVTMMQRSLAQGTAQLPLADGVCQAFPRNTHDAITSGTATAQAGAVLRQWLRLRAHSGATPALFVSGGNWPLLAAEVTQTLAAVTTLAGLPPVQPQIVSHPVLDGLAALASLQPCQ